MFKEREIDQIKLKQKISEEEQTPEEILKEAYQEIKNSLAQELLNLVKQSEPSFFERLVVELLVKNGVWWLTPRRGAGDRKSRG